MHTDREIVQREVIEEDEKALVVNDTINSEKVKELIDEVNQLPPEERVQFVSSLIGKDSGLSVVLGNGNNYISQPEIVIQINNANCETLKGIGAAIAERIRNPSR